MLQDTTNMQSVQPFAVDPCPPPPHVAPAVSSIPRSTSTTSTKRPATPSAATTTTTSTWREEESILKHQLRAAKAEIAQLQAKLGIKNNAVPFNSSSPSRKPLVPTSSESSSSPSVERQLSVSPTLNRTRRVSSSSSAASSTSDPPPPPPNAPLPPVPTTTRIPVAVNATGGYAPVGPVALNRALLSNDANGATQPRRSSTSEPTTDESTTTTSKTVNVPTLVTPTGPDPSLADPTTGREPKNDAEEAIDRSLSPPPILLAARQSRLSDPTYNHHSQRYHQQYLASSSTSSSARPENPFFGSGTPARERLTKSASSAQSGSGKVISGLQSELLQAKNALESTRGQLRLSQRAVDFLGRQNEDLKETKERLNNEIESLTRQLNRRERTSEETLARARTAESSLATLQVEHKQYVHAHKHRTRDLEESERRARDDSKRVEVEYEQLRNGIASMQHGWKRDLEWLKQSLANKEKELDAKHVALEKLFKTRSREAESASTTMTTLSAATTKFNSTFAHETGHALRSLDALVHRQRADAQLVEVVSGQMGRLRRNIERAERGERINSLEEIES